MTLPDICVLAVFEGDATFHARIRVVDGEIRSIISQAVRDWHNASTAAILDMIARNQLRACTHDVASPTLVYSWMALSKCTAKVRSACGISRGMPCHMCNVRSGKIYGLNIGRVPQCVACTVLRT
jgi:hypothetical protein